MKLSVWLKNKYETMRHGDVYSNWDDLMRLTRITDSDETEKEGVSKKVLINVAIAVWHLFNCFRLSLSNIWVTESDHIMGQTFNNSGNVACLIYSCVGIVLFQWAMYRLTCAYLTWTGRMVLMQTVADASSSSREQGSINRKISCGRFMVLRSRATSWLS